MYKRVVVKIGTNVITQGLLLEYLILEQLVNQISKLHKKGVEIVLVTSGAVAAGREWLVSGAATTMQAYASVGQVRLMSSYADLFKKHDLVCAQVLVTKGDFRDREHYANMKNNFEELFRAGIVPVVNENDAIAMHEIGFSDNDELAALIAAQLNAEAVVFLSNVDGILAEGSVVGEVTADRLSSVQKYVTKERSGGGRGGMENKFKLAKKLMGQGIAAYIANGRRKNVILDILSGASVGTKFVPGGKLSAPKRRLAYADGLQSGIVYVNRGAADVLRSKSGKSLLPVGITRIEGVFRKGDTIEIREESGGKIGSGVAQYDSGTATSLIGKKRAKELIHYDYLYID